MSRLSVTLAIVTAVAGVTLLINIALLTHATPSHDPVGRLSPSSALIRPGTTPRSTPANRESPDD